MRLRLLRASVRLGQDMNRGPTILRAVGQSGDVAVLDSASVGLVSNNCKDTGAAPCQTTGVGVCCLLPVLLFSDRKIQPDRGENSLGRELLPRRLQALASSLHQWGKLQETHQHCLRVGTALPRVSPHEACKITSQGIEADPEETWGPPSRPRPQLSRTPQLAAPLDPPATPPTRPIAAFAVFADQIYTGSHTPRHTKSVYALPPARVWSVLGQPHRGLHRTEANAYAHHHAQRSDAPRRLSPERPRC